MNHNHHDHHDHRSHAGHSPEMFQKRFWLSLLLTLPVLFWSEHIQGLFGYEAPAFFASGWIGPVLASVVFIYGGRGFMQAWHELKARLPGMMVLIALAISVAFVFSWVVQIGLIDAAALWWELATLVTIMLLGHWIEMRSIHQAQGALGALAELLPDTATRIRDDKSEERVSLTKLASGDTLLVRPGERIPTDGILLSGSSDLNEAMITGESRPAKKREGDEVIAGTINGEGALHIKVTGTGEKTKLSGIMRLVSQAQHAKSHAQHLADRAAQLLTAVALGAGVLTLILWQFLGAGIEFSIVRTVTVLVIACPHALGLAVPLVVAISTTLGAQNGLLVRDRRGLEEARNLDTVVFDKTGTLTLGEFRVIEVTVTEGIDEDEALRIAAGAEAGSALVEKTDLPATLQNAVKKVAKQGQAAIYLLKGNQAIATIAVADAIREESRAAIEALHERNIEVAMLTGDAQAVADAVARELKIDTVFAEILPEEKASKIRELQARGKKVAMVGDGVNDAPALATADIGIAIGAGTDVAVEAGHIVLVRSDPRDIPRVITLSRATHQKMVQNLWWAAGYNIFALPLAAGVLAPWGILLSPAIGAVLMSASTVIVAINAQLLRRVRL